MKPYVQRKSISNIEVLTAYVESKQFTDRNIWIYPYDILQERFDCCFKVAYRAMERACDADLVEYGVTLRGGWLTRKGRELLAQKNCEIREVRFFEIQPRIERPVLTKNEILQNFRERFKEKGDD